MKKIMKLLIILLSIMLIGVLIVQIFAWKSQKDIETYSFVVENEFNNFEIRNYEAALFTSVKLNTNEYKVASGKGFSILAGYIFGNNESDQKISMTSPVAMALEDSVTMMFLVPNNLKKENLPTPNEGSIEFKEMPSKRVAAISFGGWANSDRIEEYKKKLIIALNEEGIAHTNKFSFLGYNAPFELFNRKNDIIVEL